MARPTKNKDTTSTAKSSGGVKRALSDEPGEHQQEEKRSKTSADGAAVTKRGPGRPRKSAAAASTANTNANGNGNANDLTTKPRRSVAGLPGSASSRRARNSLAPNGILERTMRLSILPLATAPNQHSRPGKTLLVWGCGDSGEFGMGPDEEQKGEIGRPRLHGW
ncbi:hypothetical protein QFC24_005700 [Naganishia onofrii]|uniref:Uncharacterized protein n=1 Tax=Naganishia onofrii TaxID=1851511 RepID=A0ACC2X6C9_9TREE|nr:hypothetical protein QFC24_005700 [Naganishia onofrii]